MKKSMKYSSGIFFNANLLINQTQKEENGTQAIGGLYTFCHPRHFVGGNFLMLIELVIAV